MAMVAKYPNFYRPAELPNSEDSANGANKIFEIRRIHGYYNHPSVNEMKRMTDASWHNIEGKFCTGCQEGKLKEHARRSSTKPLNATRPGENGVADLMFIVGRNDVKTPFYVHVDVATRLIIGQTLRDKTYGSVLHAIEFVDDQHKLWRHKLEQLVFDRESAIAVMQEDIKARGIKLTLKAAGKKVGLAEVTIRLIREKPEPRRLESEPCMDSSLRTNSILTYAWIRFPF